MSKTVLISLIAFVICAVFLMLLSSPKENNKTAQVQPSSTPAVDQDQVLVDQVKKQIVSEHGQVAEGLEIVIDEVDGDYAKGAANEANQGGGGLWFAAKVNGEWNLVYDGNGIITCDQLTNYQDFPNSMIPACYDKPTSEMVNR